MSLYALMSHMDTVLSLAEKGEISAVMIALKGAYGLLAYQSAAASKFYSPYDTPLMDHTYTMEQVQEAVQKLKDAGLYVAARLETFNDPALAGLSRDHDRLLLGVSLQPRSVAVPCRSCRGSCITWL
jgi:hypothetical protein